MARNFKKKKLTQTLNENQYNMKVVTSETCQTCKTKCKRGMAYLEKMSQPGAIGYGGFLVY